ncbi:MAG: hypothetical protein AAFO87_04000 [Cyanobacteria bacterium J06607_6]
MKDVIPPKDNIHFLQQLTILLFDDMTHQSHEVNSGGSNQWLKSAVLSQMPLV